MANLQRTRPDGARVSTEIRMDGLETAVELKRSPRARRMKLKVDEARRAAVLILPPHARMSDAGDFLARHFDWLRERLDEMPEPVPFREGAAVPLRGVAHRVVFGVRPRGRGAVWIEPGEPAPKLVVGGDPVHAPRRLRDWLKAQARAELANRAAFHARALGVTPARIAVRDQTTRWGSCSAGGVLSFSWRLILAPSYVLDYVAAHEVAHLREMNHGRRFWQIVDDLMPRTGEARAWLKRHGSGLHRYGADN